MSRSRFQRINLIEKYKNVGESGEKMQELQIISAEYGECGEKRAFIAESQICQKLTAELTKYLLHRKNCKKDGSREKNSAQKIANCSKF